MPRRRRRAGPPWADAKKAEGKSGQRELSSVSARLLLFLGGRSRAQMHEMTTHPSPPADGPSAAPGLAADEPFSIKFVSIAGSPSRESASTAMVTPISAETLSPPSLSQEVPLLPLELLSFGYACGGAPKNCARVVNCSHIANSHTSSPGSALPMTPHIEELCSFLVCELQALAVGKSPVRRTFDSPSASPLLSPDALPQLADSTDVAELLLPSPLRPGAQTSPPASLAPPAPAPSDLATATGGGSSHDAHPPLPPLLPGTADVTSSESSLLNRVSPQNSSTSPLLGRLIAQPLPTTPTTPPRAAAPAQTADSSPPPPPPNLPSIDTLSCEPSTTPGESAAASTPQTGSSSVESPVRSPRSLPPRLRVAIGCKDGSSISVAIAEHLVRQLSNRGLVARARHRELERHARRARKAILEGAVDQQGSEQGTAGTDGVST